MPMALRDQLYMIKSHIGASPARRIFSRSAFTFRGMGGEGLCGSKMRLANKRGLIASLGQGSSKPTSGRKSIPLSFTPLVLGNLPVRIAARAGWHTGAGVIQELKCIPAARKIQAGIPLLIRSDEYDIGPSHCKPSCHNGISLPRKAGTVFSDR